MVAVDPVVVMMESVVNTVVMMVNAVVVMSHTMVVMMTNTMVVMMTHTVVVMMTVPPVPSSATRHSRGSGSFSQHCF